MMAQVVVAPHATTPARKILVADFVLVRVAMLSYDAVIDLVPLAFRAALMRAATAVQSTRQRADELSQELHGIVPLCPDARTRRAVLALRRELYGGSVRDHDAALRLLQSLPLGPAVARLAAMWHETACDALATAANLSVQWSVARPFGAEALRAMLARPEIGAAVSVASPELVDMLGRSDRGKRLKAELSLARYVTRAATKTSPFSSLTGVLPSAFGADPGGAVDLSDVTWANHARVNRALCAALDYATGEMLAEHPQALVVRNASLHAVDDSRAQWLEPRYFALLGRPWREARNVCVRIHPAVIAMLLTLDGPCRVEEVERGFHELGLGPQQARTLLTLLLKRGALRNAQAPDAYTLTPETSLLERDAVESHGRLSARFSRLREHVDAIGSAGFDVRERILAEARREADALVKSVNMSGELELKNVVLETCTGRSASPVVGLATQRLCADVARVAQRGMSVNPVYGVLREFFVRTYGPAGRIDLVTFVAQAGRLCADAATFERLEAAIPRRPAPLVAAPFTVFGQLCSGADVRFVINSIVAGTGQLAARYAAADCDGSGIVRRSLRAWLARCAGDALATDVTLAGDCNDLQAHAQITERILPWAADFVRPDRAGVDRADELFVEYDEALHALRVRGRDGCLRALTYLGAVYLNPAYGPEYFLQALGQPYIVLPPQDDRVDEAAGEIVAFERIIEDGIVLRRAKWLVRAEFFRSWFARGDVTDLIDIRLDREREGLPAQFFAKAVIAGARHRLDAPLDARKPQWIDSENPVCLALLRRLIDVSPWVEIVEMLPDRACMAVGGDGLPYATELQFEIAI